MSSTQTVVQMRPTLTVIQGGKATQTGAGVEDRVRQLHAEARELLVSAGARA